MQQPEHTKAEVCPCTFEVILQGKKEKKGKKQQKHILVKQISESPKKSKQVAVTGNTLSKKAITCLCFTFLVK